MSIELTIPEVGESITDVEIGQWLKAVGDLVRKDEPVVVVETDKVNVEVIAPADGRVTEVLKKDGEAALVGEVVGYMEAGEVPRAGEGEPGNGKAPGEAKAPAAAKASRGAKIASESKSTLETKPAPRPAAPPPSPSAKDDARGGGGRVMPSAARLLHEHDLAADEVRATGPGGRILKEDVQRHVADAKRPAAKAPAPESGQALGGEEEVVPMTSLRRRIAERLVTAQQQAALLTTFNEVDMSAVAELRAAHKSAFEERHGVKLGLMSFFVKSAVAALQLVPAVNAEIRGTDIVYRNFYDIGVAVGGGKGLVVPVLRGAERMSFADIERTIRDYAVRAQEGTLQLAELQGGTFTISNGGVYGSMLSTPIVNPPQSGILGLHAIQDRPVAVNGQVVVRPVMYVALTYDHRIIDGREAVTFLKRVKECIEAPARMLLEV